MGRWSNLSGYDGSAWKTTTQVKYYNGSTWVDMGSDDDPQTDYINGVFNNSTKKYNNQLYRYNGSSWAQVSKDPTYSGELYAYGEITRASADPSLNNAYYSSSSASYYFFEFRGYVRAEALPIRLVGAYVSLTYPKGYGTSTSSLSTNAKSNQLTHYEWDMWINPNGYVAYRAAGSSNTRVRYSLRNETDWTSNWHYVTCGSYRPTYASSFSSSYRWTSYCGFDGATVNVMRTTEGGSTTDTSSTGYHYGKDHAGIIGGSVTSGITGGNSNIYGTVSIKYTNAKTTVKQAAFNLDDGTLYNVFTASSDGTWTTTNRLRQDYTWS